MSSTARAADRQPDDFYETPDWATRAILPHLKLTGLIFEPCAGHGAIAKELVAAGVPPTNLLLNELDAIRAERCERETGIQTFVSNFLTEDFGWAGCIDLVITNPPYSLAEECIRRSLRALTPGGEVAMLLRLNFLAGLKRVPFWWEHPADVLVLPKRPSYVTVVRDIYRCRHCKRKWKVAHGAGPFVIEVDDQCECGQIPTFLKTTKTKNDSCEYGWFVWGATRTGRLLRTQPSLQEKPVVQKAPKQRKRGGLDGSATTT